MQLPDRERRDDEMAALLLLLLTWSRLDLGDWRGGVGTAGYWERSERLLGERLEGWMFGVWSASVEFHGGELDGDAVLAGREWARENARVVAGLVTGTSRRMLEEFVGDWRERERRGEVISEVEIEEKFGRVFGSGRAVRIAVDVVTRAQTAGGEWSVGRQGLISVDDIWWTEGDELVCPVCGPWHGRPRREWEVEFPEGPPSPHPVCRCTVQYVRLVGQRAA